MMGELLAAAGAMYRREILIAWRRIHDVLLPLIFFALVTTLFPLGVGPESAILKALAPGVLWVGALLSTLLSLHRLFDTDYGEGILEQVVLAPHPLSVLVLAKTAAHWTLSGLPLVVMAPLLAVALHLPDAAMGTLVMSLFLGTPVLSLLGSVGAALALGVRGGGVLVSALVLPLYTPVLIFGASAVSSAATGLPSEAQLSLLAAFLAVTLVMAPWATAAALRVSLD